MIYYHMHTMLSNATAGMDSITPYQSYVTRAKELGCKAMAITEHGNTLEWLHKKQSIEKAGMRYIHGVEAYVTETHTPKDGKKIKDNYHIILMARNFDGFKELNRLVSMSFNRENVKVVDDVVRFYNRPRISYDELKRTSNNIIITTACVGGIFGKDSNLSSDFIKFLSDNKHRCFLEIQHHTDEKQGRYNQRMVGMSEQYGIKLIAGTDTHMLNEDETEGRRLLQVRKGMDKSEAGEETWQMAMYTKEELIELYKKQGKIDAKYYTQALDNTDLLYGMTEDYKIDTSNKYPTFSENPVQEVAKICKDAAIVKGIEMTPDVRDKLNYEMATYKKNGALNLMLLEYEIKSWAKANDIFYGESRGSAAGSMIAYLMDITRVNSMQHKLNFERFMNSERISLADIDTDWPPSKRELIKKYIHDNPKYYSAEIVTFNTIAQKGSIRDIAGAMNIDLAEVNKICATLENDKDLQKNMEKYKSLFKYARIVEGTVTSIGSHPAATICSPIDLIENVGVITISTNDYPISCLNMKEIESLNFVKLDVLGLDNVEIIDNTCKLAGIETLQSDKMNFEDEAVWASINESAVGVFQFEGEFAHTYLCNVLSEQTLKNIRRFNPAVSKLYLMAVANGAIRPAGQSYRDALARGELQDNGHNALNTFLKDTNGYLVFQEQIIEFLNKFCGYTMGEADVVRRAFSKKIGTEVHIPKIKSGFIVTMKEKYGTQEEESEKLIVNFLQVIEDASAYLFSLNHSLPYSMLGYMCIYLRHYYKIEFLTVLLDMNYDDMDKTAAIMEYINTCTDIKVLSPRFRKSIATHRMDKANNIIYKGIKSIKGLNDNVASELYKLKDSNIKSFVDLLKDISGMGINDTQLKTLIKLDFFEEFGKSQKLCAILDLYNTIGKSKVFSKKKEIDHALEALLKTHSRETESQYRDIDTNFILDELCANIPNENIPIRERITTQLEMMGYIDLGIKCPKSTCIVMDINIKYKPKVTLMSLRTGKTVVAKITKDLVCDIEKMDLLTVDKLVQEPGWMRTEDDKWVRDEKKMEWHVKKFTKLSDNMIEGNK